MAYDLMGNYTGEYDYTTPVAPVDPMGETEEQRRKREEEERKRAEKEAKRADETAVQEQKVITYENGSKTIETKQEVPAGGKVQPVAPDYNQRIAQQESGNKPDIGFHDRNKSSAYGTYGMTAGAYEDARRVNPNLPEDITQASPEQQTQAQNAYTQQNAKYLQAYGVEPNENTLAAAHFLGAKGLSDYLKTGYISEAAAKANGGADNVRRIVNQRLGGQAAPASGAAQRPQPVQPVAPEAPTAQAQPAEPVSPVAPEAPQAPAPQNMYSLAKPEAKPTTSAGFIDQYQTAQNDPAALMKLGTDDNVPDQLRDRARNRAADLITQQREQAKAQEELSKKNPSELARMMTERKKDGSWGKYILFGMLGMTALRDEESTKLGIGTDKVVTDADGKSYLVKVGANGAPIEGFNAEGKALSAEEMIQAMGAGSAIKKDIVGGTYVNDKTGEVGRVVSDPKTGTSYVQTDSGRKPMAGFRPQSSAGTMDMQKAQQVQKQNIDLAGDWAKLQMKVQGAAPEAANKYLGEFNAKHGTQFGLQSVSGSAPQISMETGQMSQAAPTQAAPIAPAQAAAPQGQTQLQPVNPNAPVTAPQGASPADIESARKKREEQEKVQRELGQKSSEGVIKHRDEKLVPAADGGQQGSDIVRRQFAVMNDPRSNALFGLMNKAQSMSTSDKNWAVVRDVLAGKIDSREAGKDLPEKWVDTNLDPDQKSLLETMKADTAALATATIKSGGFGAQVSDRDRASAEKMQLNIAEVPALGMFQGKAQQLFNFDMSRAKSDWAATKNFDAVDQLEKAWRKEQATLVDQYGKIADERNAFIKTNSDGKPATIGLVRDAYRRYPVPQYDPNLNAGEGGWKNLRKRDLNEILKGNR